MENSVFKPKYTTLVYALFVLYAAPWLFSVPNALFGRSAPDWKVFWLLAGTVWSFAGLLHMKSALLKRIVFDKEIQIEMALQKPISQSGMEPVQIFGETVVFSGRIIPTRYLANGNELLQLVTVRSERGGLNVVYEERGRKDAGWSVERNLFVLIGFSLYMMAMLALRLRLIHIIGPATDALLLGWACALPVLLAIRIVKWVKARIMRRETAPKWI